MHVHICMTMSEKRDQEFEGEWGAISEGFQGGKGDML